MKQFTILILYLAAIPLFAQSQKNKEICSLKMTKKEVIKMEFNNTDCPLLEGEILLHFKFKVPKYKTVFVKGNTLTNEAKSYISKASIGDVIAVFDITLASEEKMPPVMITLIE